MSKKRNNAEEIIHKLREATVSQNTEIRDLPASTGPGSGFVYAASWFMGDSFPGTMI
jgi:hypothetical protein